MKRQIIKIDRDKCDGCGQCVTACVEGAIALIDGKAELISESYCDGLGACIGECPTGALVIEERDAPEFDEEAVKRHMDANAAPAPAGCPSSAVRNLEAPAGCPGSAMRNLHAATDGAAAAQGGPSQLSHWPVQLNLVPLTAPFLAGADLLICADCVPFALPDFHERFLSGRAVLVGCPKLDDLSHYAEKLGELFKTSRPASITVLRMEVPCCGGIAHVAVTARDQSAPHLSVTVHTIGIEGGVSTEVIPPLVAAESEEV